MVILKKKLKTPSGSYQIINVCNVLEVMENLILHYNISFNLFNKIIKKLGSLSAVTTKQRTF